MKQSAYDIEYKRAFLALNNKKRELQKTYLSKLPEIKDKNSSDFWNTKLNVHESIHQQDGMTKDRCSIASDFLPLSVTRLLDIGIGHGWVEELISDRKIELYGCDISNKTVKNVKERLKGHFTVQSIYNLRYKNNFFDAILMLEVLEHIPPSKTFRVLKSIQKLLSNKGYLLVSVPTNEGLETKTDNPSGHVRMYTIPLIRAELEMNGFKVIKVKTLYAFKKNYQLKKLLAIFLLNRWKPNNIIILAQKT